MDAIATVLLSAILLISQEVQSASKINCTKANFDIAFPAHRYVIYGVRSDGRILILPSDIIKELKSDDYLRTVLDSSFSKGTYQHWQGAMLMEVDGVLQFLLLHQNYYTKRIPVADAPHSEQISTRLSYFRSFRMIFEPEIGGFTHEAELNTIASIGGTRGNPYIPKTTKDNRLFLHKQNSTEQLEVFLMRNGTKLIVRAITRQLLNDSFETPLILDSMQSYDKWLWIVRRQQSVEAHLDCLANISYNYELAILYNRKHLIDAYYNMGDAALDCYDDKCKKRLRDNGGKDYHEKEVRPVHKKGSTFVGYRNGYIFSYRHSEAWEPISGMLLALDHRHQVFKEGLIDSDTEEVHLFSIDGRETIALICGPVSYYGIYNTKNIRNIKIINVDKKKMARLKELKKKCNKADYDVARERLIIYVDKNTALQVKLTKKLEGRVQSYKKTELIRHDIFRNTTKNYNAKEAEWPWHLHNGRALLYNKGYISHFRSQTQKQKLPLMYYGIRDCTFFVAMTVEGAEKVGTNKMGCNPKYKMRAILEDSYMTVIRTVDDTTVEVISKKVSINYNEVEAAIKKSKGTISYTYHFVDTEFQNNNSFVIAPGTFETIHYIDGFMYYQMISHTDCTYHIQRRKITESDDKEVESFTFPAMADQCKYAIDSVIKDEELKTFIYVMKRDEEYLLATPSDDIADDLQAVEKEEFVKNRIYASSYPYILYQDPNSGPSMRNVTSAGQIMVSFKEPFHYIGFYKGKILYTPPEKKYILGDEIDMAQYDYEDAKDAATEAVDKHDFEKAAFEEETAARGPVLKDTCDRLRAPYFLAFILKISILDLLLTLLLIILILYHRMHIIPARRRYKIMMGILKHRKKRKLADRARRRLRKLMLLKKIAMKKKKEEKEKSKAPAGPKKEEESSSSSSEMVTAGGRMETKTEMGPPVASTESPSVQGATSTIASPSVTADVSSKAPGDSGKEAGEKKKK